MEIEMNKKNESSINPDKKKKPFEPAMAEVINISPEDIIHTSGHSNDLFLDFGNSNWDSQWGD